MTVRRRQSDRSFNQVARQRRLNANNSNANIPLKVRIEQPSNFNNTPHSRGGVSHAFELSQGNHASDRCREIRLRAMMRLGDSMSQPAMPDGTIRSSAYAF